MNARGLGESMMFTAYFWKSTLERAIKSFAQALLAVLGVGQVSVLDVSWLTALSTAAMAGLLSVLTSIGSSTIGPSRDPSLVGSGDGDDHGAAPPPRHAAVAV
jgi:hypothetical protein